MTALLRATLLPHHPRSHFHTSALERPPFGGTQKPAAPLLSEEAGCVCCVAEHSPLEPALTSGERISNEREIMKSIF